MHDEENETRNTTRETEPRLELGEEHVYRRALEAMNSSGIQYTVGAAFARWAYTGIWRATKDLDVFLRAEDLPQAMRSLEQAGFYTYVADTHWLAKARLGGVQIDLIFAAGHGKYKVDCSSFEGAQAAKVLGIPVRLMPIEEMISLAVFVALRHRFDGSEVVHLILKAEGRLNWQRVLDRLDGNRQILLWHLVLFDFVYPGHPEYLPKEIMENLYGEMRRRWQEKAEVGDTDSMKPFRGYLLDPFSFRVDVEDWGYEDRRDLKPIVNERGELL
jgi:hypothetical protein